MMTKIRPQVTKAKMDNTYTKAEIEKGRKLFAGDCDFVAGVTSLSNLLPMSLPEVAFVGRSNVGKSSLMNAITGRKALARTSHTPGRTQQLNYFDLGKQLYLVDLPGYGYAKASKTKVAAWNNLIRQYLSGRRTLQRVCVLVDSRHGLKDTDIEIMKLLDDVAVTYIIVLTKIDKVKTQELEKCRNSVLSTIKTHPAAYPFIYETSSAKGEGLDELRGELAKFAQ